MDYNIVENLKLAASATLPAKPRNKKTSCPIIEKLSEKQKKIRLDISCDKDPKSILHKKKERNIILKEIKSQQTLNAEIEIDKLATEIEASTDSQKTFKATKLILNINKKKSAIVIHNQEGKPIDNDKNKLETIAQHYTEKYKGNYHITPFLTPSKLDNPIDTKEIKEAITKLNLNKATGPDQIQAELLKATQDTVAPQLAEIFNNCFEKEVDIDLNINLGNLLLIQKPGKPKGPIANLRPIVLLSTFRKILSIVTLGRIRNKIENYLSASQAGFRPNRSTTDIVFAHKILIARIKKYQESFTILGIDLSSAFDTIHRDKLLDILKDIVDRDELTLIRFLLANTKLNLTCGNESTELTTIIGTPQGDSLSPILFVVYLEAALRELRPKLPTSTRFEPSELIYADDCDLIFDTPIEAKQSVPIIVETLGNWNLKVNASKTEFTTINRNTLEWQKTRKLGSLLDDQEDLKRRKQLATVAFKNLQAVWVRKNRIIKEDKILSLYNSLVLPILTYNCSTWSLTKKTDITFRLLS